MKFVLEVADENKARELAGALRFAGHVDQADQLAGAASHLDLGPKLSTHRHATKEAADLVAGQMQPLTNTRVYVDYDPVEGHDREKGVGDWNICYQNGRELESCASYRMGACATTGELLALADALREHEPDHPLLQTWHLRSENRSKLSRYYA